MATGAGERALSSNDASLDESDLKYLCEALHPVRLEYHSLGLQIDVHLSEIECIEAEHSSVSDRLREVLKARLRKTEALTWTDISRALRSNTVNKPRLADSIMFQSKGTLSESSSSNKISELSSSSSSASDDSEFDIHFSEVELKKLRKVFKRLFGRLCYAIKNPVEIATLLQKRGLLAQKKMSELLTSPESEQTKAITLVRALDKSIKSCPSRIFTVIDVFLDDDALQEIGREMWTETGKL